MEHVHGSYESPYDFRINSFTKEVTYQGDNKIIIAQGDHNSTRFLFSLLKEVDEHDMSLCDKIRVHYINVGSNGERCKGMYEVKDLKTSDSDENMVEFSWLLTRNATSLDGALSFVIQFVCTTNNELDYSWSTVINSKDVTIAKTYDNSEDIIVDDYADIIEQWKEELFESFELSIDDYYTKDEVDEMVSTACRSIVDVSLVGITTSEHNDMCMVYDDNIQYDTKNTFKIHINGQVSMLCRVYVSQKPVIITIDDDTSKTFIVTQNDTISYDGLVSQYISISVEEAGAVYFDNLQKIIDVEGLATDVEDLKATTKSEALIARASGEIVRVDDVSATKTPSKVTISSKNLAVRKNSQTTVTTEGITYTVNEDGTITANGTATGTAYYLMLGNTNYESQVPIKRGRYTIGLAPAQGCRISVGIHNHENETRYLYYSTNTNTVTFDITSDTARFDMILCVDKDFTVNNTVFKPMLEAGDIAHEYTPYVDPATVTVSRFGKNLFPPLNPMEKDGMKLTKVNDYYILNGTATSSGLFTTTMALAGGTYTLSASNPTHNGLDLAIVQVYSDTTKNSLVAKDNAPYSEYTATISAANNYQFRIRYESGVTYNNYIVKPQLELGTEFTEYKPYDRLLYTPASDGTVEIESVAPIMTILTNTPGVNIDLEYNQDHNMAMNAVRSDIKTLDDMIANMSGESTSSMSATSDGNGNVTISFV